MNKQSALKALSASVDVGGIEAKAFLSCAKDLGLFLVYSKTAAIFQFLQYKNTKKPALIKMCLVFKLLIK
jgi:hypothetical protein